MNENKGVTGEELAKQKQVQNRDGQGQQKGQDGPDIVPGCDQLHGTTFPSVGYSTHPCAADLQLDKSCPVLFYPWPL